MQSLNKENFWQDIQDSFPDLYRQWRDWLGEYMKQDAWTQVVREGVDYDQLPFDMQTGIVYSFFRSGLQMDMIGMFDVTDPLEMAQTVKDVFSHRFLLDLEQLADDVLRQEREAGILGPPSEDI